MKRAASGIHIYLTTAFFALLSILAVLLFSEYRFFQGQVDALLRVQHDYQRYLFDLKDKLTTYEELIGKVRVKAPAPAQLKEQRPTEAPDKLFRWPIKRSDFWISSFFGRRKRANGAWEFHYGIDMAAFKGTEVRAADDGVVRDAIMGHRGFGNTIVLVHNHKYRSRYAHLDKINKKKVKKGEKIKRGELIGWVGDTGQVRKDGHDASHLHFEVYYLGKQVDPMPLLP